MSQFGRLGEAAEAPDAVGVEHQEAQVLEGPGVVLAVFELGQLVEGEVQDFQAREDSEVRE